MILAISDVFNFFSKASTKGVDKKTTEKYWKKICAFCTYRERSTHEVEEKLKAYGLEEEERIFLIERLQKESYLDENRFAEVFSRGKFNSRSWGKMKITRALRQKGVDPKIGFEALTKIEEEEYEEKAFNVAEMKAESLDLREANQRARLLRFMISKGYEYDLAYRILSKLSSQDR